MTAETQLIADISSPLPSIIAVLKEYAPPEFKPGQTLEDVHMRYGWLECIRFMEEKILHNTTRKPLPERK